VVGRYLLVGFLVLTTAVGVSAGVGTPHFGDETRILPGVAVAGINVSGLTAHQAATRVKAALASRLSRSLVLRLPEESIQFSYEQLGLRTGNFEDAVSAAAMLGQAGPLWSRWKTRVLLAWAPIDIAVPYTRDEGVLVAALTNLAQRLPQRARDAEVAVREGRLVVVTSSQVGQGLDVQATRERIDVALEANAEVVDAVVHLVAPRFTTEDAQTIGAPIASYTTKLAPIPNRTHNIALAAGAIRGWVLAPGQEFSYNRALGPTTLQRGFLEAPIILNDELVPGEGGGVCQVSSTLFNVALLADLQVLARANHSRPVAYLPLGRDATTDGVNIDLRFRNTTGHFLVLWASVDGQTLTVTAYGTPVPGREVSIVVTDREEIVPPEGTVMKEDPELDAGQVVTRDAQVGYRAKTYRLVTVDGQLIRSDLVGMSYYRPLSRTVKVGTKKSVPPLNADRGH
jgi:vancomycin resistance protein YoaR